MLRTSRVHVNVFLLFFFFFNDTATTEIYTLSLHDALPIYQPPGLRGGVRQHARDHPDWRHPRDDVRADPGRDARPCLPRADRKSTRLNSSHANISYAVFCLKKKKIQTAQSAFHSTTCSKPV